jgi:hydrogenase-4 membrane subunit HyfE
MRRAFNKSEQKERIEDVNIYEAVGLTWIILTSLLATAGILYFAYIGVKISIKMHQGAIDEIPAEVRKMFKIA